MTRTPGLSLKNRAGLMFALAAERLWAFYEHGQWMTDAQASTLAAGWMARRGLQLPADEKKCLAALSDDFARTLAGSLSREAGLYTAHDMMEALDPNHQSALSADMRAECERLLVENGFGD